MMMNRRHPEDAAPGRLERGDLDDDGERLDHKDAADDDEKKLLLDEQRDNPERATQTERSHVAHEDVRGVGVPPQESKAGADERSTEDRQFGFGGVELDELQVAREFRVSREVRE